MTTPEPEAPDTGLGQRVGALEQGQQSILSRLDQLLAGPEPEPEPGRPEVNIVDEIRRQLDERDRKAKPKTEPAAKAAPEPEQPPVPPVLRRHKIMGWAE